MAPPTWRRPAEALGVVFGKANLRRTLIIACIVGTVPSLVNQAHLVIGGDATLATWLRIAANYAVPFCVSNVGVLTATRAPRSTPS